MTSCKSRSARSAWIEIFLIKTYIKTKVSRSARSAWIEIWLPPSVPFSALVALRSERVD